MNPVALITGGSRGIGRGIGLELARAGFDLVINFAGNTSAAERTAKDCAEVGTAKGVRVEICQADISNSGDRHRLLATTEERFGRLDGLVNNAGVAPSVRADILEASEESFDRLISINVKAPYFLTQQAARWMIEQKAKGGGLPLVQPKIITISSVSAYAASTNRGDYCVAK